MKLDWLCAEKATAVSLGCAGLMLADGGLITGGAIAGAGLLSLWSKARRADGVNSEKLLADARARLLKDFSGWAEGRELAEADVIAADKAMADHLADCVPPVADLAKTTFHAEEFPGHAAHLVVERLAERNPIFSATHTSRSPAAREFALLVMTSALSMAKEQPEFLQRLTQEILVLVPGYVVRIEDAVKAVAAESQAGHAETHERLARLEAKLEGRFDIPNLVLRDTVMQELTLRPGLNDDEVAEAVRNYCAEHKRLEQRLTHLEVFDNRIAALKADAALALAAWDHAGVAALYSEMRAITDERNREGTKRAAEFAAGEAEALMMTRDWQAALAVWRDATAKLRPYDPAGADALVESGGRKLLEHGQLYPGGALAAAAEAFSSLAESTSLNSDRISWAARKVLLGIALQEQGKRGGGAEGLALLAEAVAAYRAALEVYTRADMPAAWAGTQNNLGIALQEQGKRSGGAEGLALLAEAVAAYRAALEVRTRADMPAAWAGTQNNLGIALQEQGKRSDGAEGPALLAGAVAAYRAALEVRTRADMPADWAMTQNNLGTALKVQGTRSGGADGPALLAGAVAAYRAALEVYTRADMPADWAMTQNNLGNALQEQGTRSGGAEGLALLAEAVAAYRAALEVRTRNALPAGWAMTQANIALAQEARGDLSEGAAQADHWRAAEAAVLLALEVYDPVNMAFYHEKATRLLARIRAKLAGGG